MLTEFLFASFNPCFTEVLISQQKGTDVAIVCLLFSKSAEWGLWLERKNKFCWGDSSENWLNSENLSTTWKGPAQSQKRRLPAYHLWESENIDSSKQKLKFSPHYHADVYCHQLCPNHNERFKTFQFWCYNGLRNSNWAVSHDWIRSLWTVRSSQIDTDYCINLEPTHPGSYQEFLKCRKLVTLLAIYICWHEYKAGKKTKRKREEQLSKWFAQGWRKKPCLSISYPNIL